MCVNVIVVDKSALQDALKLWATLMQRQFKVIKSNKEQYIVKCEKDGCPWRVHA